MNGVMAVFMIIFFIIVGAVILTGVGIVFATWCFPGEKGQEQQENNECGSNDTSVSS